MPLPSAQSGDSAFEISTYRSRRGFCTRELEASGSVQTQYALHSNAICTAARATHKPHVAIQFARARYLSRASGGNAVRSAAYNAREAIEAERTGEVFYFRHRDAPEHHEVLLPEGARRAIPRYRQCCGTRRNRPRSAGTRRSRARSSSPCRPIRDHRRGPHRDGAVVCRAAFCRQGTGGAARRARAA